jgi:hypothetical protein
MIFLPSALREASVVLKLADNVTSTLQTAAVAIGLLSSLGVQAAATTFREGEFTCPIGGQKFKAMFVASNTYWSRRLDLKPIAPTPESVPSPLPVCPDNGFVMYKADFSTEELNTLTPIVLSDEYRRERAGNVSYFMVAYMHERMGASDEEIAMLYLQASWEAEMRSPQLVGRYRSLSLERLERVLERDQRWEIALLAAELQRLLARFDAVEARLAAIPAGVLDEGRSKVFEQIRKHTQSRNSEPQRFVAK